MKRTRLLTLSSLLISGGIVAGISFHAMGIGGQVALPLHYPPLLAGYLLGWRRGLVVGLITPLLSALLTGMPPMIPSAVLMVFECAVYGLTAGLLRNKIGVYPTLLTALILGRLAWGISLWMLTPVLGLQIPVLAALLTALMVGIPGIIGQMIIVPLLVARIEKIYGE